MAAALRLLAAAAILLAMSSGAALAVEPDEILDDPALEERARSISAGLRCLVCQNQSIDDSDAPLAKDLRVLVRERLVAGDSDAEIVGYVVDRYGEFVLLNPRVAPHTYALWLTPPVLLVIGALLVWSLFRRRAPGTAGGPALTSEEERRLGELMAGKDDTR